MKQFILSVVLGLFAVSSFAAKPEWAGNKEAKSEQKADKNGAKKAQEKKEKVSKKTKDKASKGADSEERLLSDIFSDRERDVIRDYYNENAKSGTGKHKGKKKELPYGLQKKLERGGELPPGWQKKVNKGEVLDSDLRASATELPEDLLSRLPVSDSASEVIRLGDKIIRVGSGQGTVVDIIDLADILSGAL